MQMPVLGDNFLFKNFNSRYLTIHEDSFKIMKKWRGHYKRLFLEMNYNNLIPRLVDVKRIGGFCVDMSHFKSAEERWTNEFEYIFKRKKMYSKYPIYILSKGRWESRLTVKSLDEMNTDYKIVVEPSEYENYANVIDSSKIIKLPIIISIAALAWRDENLHITRCT